MRTLLSPERVRNRMNRCRHCWSGRRAPQMARSIDRPSARETEREKERYSMSQSPLILVLGSKLPQNLYWTLPPCAWGSSTLVSLSASRAYFFRLFLLDSDRRTTFLAARARQNRWRSIINSPFFVTFMLIVILYNCYMIYVSFIYFILFIWILYKLYIYDSLFLLSCLSIMACHYGEVVVYLI